MVGMLRFITVGKPEKPSSKINAKNYQALDTKIIKKKALVMSDIFDIPPEKTKRKKKKKKVKNKKIKIKNTL